MCLFECENEEPNSMRTIWGSSELKANDGALGGVSLGPQLPSPPDHSPCHPAPRKITLHPISRVPSACVCNFRRKFKTCSAGGEGDGMVEVGYHTKRKTDTCKGEGSLA